MRILQLITALTLFIFICLAEVASQIFTWNPYSTTQMALRAAVYPPEITGLLDRLTGTRASQTTVGN
jgi:hypothetical protein